MQKLTIPQLFAQSIEKFGDHPALHRQTRSGLEVYSYEVLNAHVEKLARWILDQGGQEGDRIALAAPNGPDWVVAALATLKAGRVLVPLDMQFTPDEILGLVDHSGATALFVSQQYADNSSLSDYPGLSIWPLEDLNRDVTRLEGREGPMHEADPDDTAILLYTSGTSGAPKGVPMTHHNVTSNVLDVTSRLHPTSRDVWLSLLPLSHGLELCMGLLCPLCIGASICYPRSRRPDLILSAMRDSGTTVMITVPAVLEFFGRAIKNKSPKGWRGSLMRGGLSLIPAPLRRRLIAALSGMPIGKIQGVVCGGAFLPPEIENLWCQLGLPIIQGYGMTEAGPVVAVNRRHGPSRQSAGKPLEMAQVRIAEPDATGVGEIQVKSPGVMTGYYKNREATAATFSRDQWLKTGDLGYMDRYGEVHIAGRSKDVIITGNGLNVYPEEVESKLQQHPLVQMACVVQRPIQRGGRRAERDGDQVWAVMVLDDEALRAEHPEILDNPKALNALMSRVLEETNSRLAPYKRPAGANLWADLPTTRSGKVQRQRVRQALSDDDLRKTEAA